MDLNTIVIIVSLVASNAITFYLWQKKLATLKKSQNNHHEFLLKVKNDIPILHTRISEIEEQLRLPEEQEMH